MREHGPIARVGNGISSSEGSESVVRVVSPETRKQFGAAEAPPAGDKTGRRKSK